MSQILVTPDFYKNENLEYSRFEILQKENQYQREALVSSRVKCWMYSVYAGVWGPHKVRYLRRLTVKWWCLPDGGWLGSAQILHNHLMELMFRGCIPSGVHMFGPVKHIFGGCIQKGGYRRGVGCSMLGEFRVRWLRISFGIFR